jgi:hypothetical protein
LHKEITCLNPILERLKDKTIIQRDPGESILGKFIGQGTPWNGKSDDMIYIYFTWNIYVDERTSSPHRREESMWPKSG